MTADEDHKCLACPDEVRGLYAAAGNAISAWKRVPSTFSIPARMAQKMEDLEEALRVIEPIVCKHFDALATRPRGKGKKP